MSPGKCHSSATDGAVRAAPWRTSCRWENGECFRRGNRSKVALDRAEGSEPRDGPGHRRLVHQGIARVRTASDRLPLPVPEQPCTCSQRRKHSPVPPHLQEVRQGQLGQGTVSGTRVALSGRHSTVTCSKNLYVLSDVFRFEADLGKRGLAGGLPEVKRRVPRLSCCLAVPAGSASAMARLSASSSVISSPGAVVVEAGRSRRAARRSGCGWRSCVFFGSTGGRACRRGGPACSGSRGGRSGHPVGEGAGQGKPVLARRGNLGGDAGCLGLLGRGFGDTLSFSQPGVPISRIALSISAVCRVRRLPLYRAVGAVSVSPAGRRFRPAGRAVAAPLAGAARRERAKNLLWLRASSPLGDPAGPGCRAGGCCLPPW